MTGTVETLMNNLKICAAVPASSTAELVIDHLVIERAVEAVRKAVVAHAFRNLVKLNRRTK